MSFIVLVYILVCGGRGTLGLDADYLGQRDPITKIYIFIYERVCFAEFRNIFFVFIWND